MARLCVAVPQLGYLARAFCQVLAQIFIYLERIPVPHPRLCLQIPVVSRHSLAQLSCRSQGLCQPSIPAPRARAIKPSDLINACFVRVCNTAQSNAFGDR